MEGPSNRVYYILQPTVTYVFKRAVGAAGPIPVSMEMFLPNDCFTSLTNTAGWHIIESKKFTPLLSSVLTGNEATHKATHIWWRGRQGILIYDARVVLWLVSACWGHCSNVMTQSDTRMAVVEPSTHT